MRLKNHFILLAICCLASAGISQPNEWLDTDFRGSACLGIVEVGDDYFAIISNGAVNEIDPDIEYKLLVNEILISENEHPDFTLIERFTLTSDEQYSTIAANYIEETKEWLFVQSFSTVPTRKSFRVLLCDENFNIESSQYLDTLGILNLIFFIDTYQGHTYVLGSLLAPPQDEVFFLDYDHNLKGVLPPIRIGQTTPQGSFWITSMRIDHITGDMLLFFYNGIQIIDTSLFQNQRYDYFDINTATHGDVLSFGNHYYSHGAYYRDRENSGFKLMLVQKYDTLFNILKSDTLGYDIHDNYPFVFKSIDEKNNEILVGAHLDGPFSHFPTFGVIKKFYLAKYDEDLNRIWYREYGGNRAYWMNGLKLLADGSAFAYGFVTDSLDQNRHAYLLHVAENGDIISSTEFDREAEHNIRLVNTGYNRIQILNPDRIIARLYLFDLNGRPLLDRRLEQETETIDVSHLPPAMYPYSVVQDGRVISSGKWMKLE